jgi:hypothetical protein
MKQSRILPALAIAMSALLMAATKAYEVVPYKNCIYETPRNTPISQTFVMTADSLIKIDFWVGDKVSDSVFYVVVRDSASNEMLAQTKAGGVAPKGSWSWMPCTLVTTSGKKIEGDTVLFYSPKRVRACSVLPVACAPELIPADIRADDLVRSVAVGPGLRR